MKKLIFYYVITACYLFVNIFLITAPVLAVPQTTTTTIAVSATVNDSVIVSATAMSFGGYTQTAASACTGSTILVTANIGTVYSVAINQGVNPGQGTGGVAGTTLAMKHGANYLIYNLYTDNICTAGVRFTTNSYSVASSITGTGVAQSYNIYGKVPINQEPPAGTYTDTITVTISFT